MINNSNEFTRRILNFPAIRPCESITYPTLITSLINLTNSISKFKSKPFFTNKKNAKTTIQLIQTLALFLEQIQNQTPDFESPTHLSLSELHFIFQKIHFLLQDCTRSDSKLWLLMKSQTVSSHFRDLMRGVTVALDVLPMAGFEVEDEGKELVEFVMKQGSKAKFEVEDDDKMAMRSVFRVIHRFEIGISPELDELKFVLEYLGIRVWSECNNEIRLLEGLLGQECEKNADFKFVSSLIAFLIYCRCIVFENVDGVRNVVDLQQHDFEVVKFLNTDDFRCPISLEIMTDPVTILTGHTYDRFSIQKWFESGNHTCPKTGERLTYVDLVPNLTLKRLIKRCCRENGVEFHEQSGGRFRDFTRPSSPGSLAAKQAMTILATFLVSRIVVGTTDEHNKACYEIRLLTKTSIFNRSCLVEANAIPPLLNLIRSSNRCVQENAIAGLLNLSKYSESKKIIVENGGLNLIVDVLNVGLKIESRQYAAGALFYLASVEEYRKTIGRLPGSIKGLMDLIRGGPDRAKKNALVTILGLLIYHENHWRFLSAGLALLLVNVLTTSEREEVIADSLAVLATLAEKLDGSMAIISVGALPLIIKMLGSSIYSRGAKEYCVSLLLAMCINDGANVVPVLVKNQSLMVDIYSILAVGSSRSSKRASSLIRILHAFSERSSSRPMMGSGFRQEQFVHVW